MQRRRFIGTLPRDHYRQLKALAGREERATDQLARFLLKRTIEQLADAQRHVEHAKA